MHRFRTGSLLLMKSGDFYEAPRYLVNPLRPNELVEILLEFWLSACGKYYIVIFNTKSRDIKRVRIAEYMGTGYTTSRELVKNFSAQDLSIK